MTLGRGKSLARDTQSVPGSICTGCVKLPFGTLPPTHADDEAVVMDRALIKTELRPLPDWRVS